MPYMTVCYSDDKWVHIPGKFDRKKTLCGKTGRNYHRTDEEGARYTKEQCCPSCWELSTGTKKN